MLQLMKVQSDLILYYLSITATRTVSYYEKIKIRATEQITEIWEVSGKTSEIWKNFIVHHAVLNGAVSYCNDVIALGYSQMTVKSGKVKVLNQDKKTLNLSQMSQYSCKLILGEDEPLVFVDWV